MSEKKHIDRLFQEKLKDFEATPSSAVWENISSNLSQKHKDRKIIPLWIKIAGIAAGIALLFTVGNSLFNPTEPQLTPNGVVDTDSDLNDQKGTDLDVNTIDNVNEVSELNDDLIKSEELDDDSNSNTKSPNLVPKANINNSKMNSVTSGESTLNASPKEALVQHNPPNEKERIQNTVEQNDLLDTQDEVTDAPNIEKENTDAFINSTQIDENAKLVEAVEVEESNNPSTEDQEEINKTSLTDALNEQEEVAEAEIEVDQDENSKRWRVMPNIAPVYFNSLGSGSSIDDQFVNNPRTGEINMSYGINGSYDFNDKLSLRAGINQVKLGYSTDNVIVYNNIDLVTVDKPLKNVELNTDSQTLSFLSANGLGFAQVPGVVADNISSSIDQEFGFIEVPVELEYKISNRKLGLSLIGGFSTLFLNHNEIYSSLQDERTLLGEATNIKKTSFSANFGLGINFNISKQFDLNFEPVFKYQLNTFSETSGNFNPYFFGVYSGLSFKF
jgi:hypothetical protein